MCEWNTRFVGIGEVCEGLGVVSWNTYSSLLISKVRVITGDLWRMLSELWSLGCDLEVYECLIVSTGVWISSIGALETSELIRVSGTWSSPDRNHLQGIYFFHFLSTHGLISLLVVVVLVCIYLVVLRGQREHWGRLASYWVICYSVRLSVYTGGTWLQLMCCTHSDIQSLYFRQTDRREEGYNGKEWQIVRGGSPNIS